MELDALVERVKALSGPDREVDLAIAQALVPDVIVLRHDRDSGENRQHTYWEYTGSIDAAVALVERKLPADEIADHEKSEIRLQFGDFGCNAVISRDTFVSERSFYGMAKTAPIALLIALLSALSGGKHG